MIPFMEPRRYTLKAPDSYHHGQLRTELIKLGLEALETEGAELISLRSLAERAGVSKTAPYRHFKDKEAFLGAVADEGFRLLCEELERAWTAADSPPDEAAVNPLVALLGRAYMDFAVGHPALYRLMNSPLVCSMPEGSMQWARRSLLILARALATRPQWGATQTAGAENPANAPARNASALDIDAVAANWGYIHGIVLLRIDGLFPRDLPEPDWNRLAATLPSPP
jgi:AcrR family transcriptional regulator